MSERYSSDINKEDIGVCSTALTVNTGSYTTFAADRPEEAIIREARILMCCTPVPVRTSRTGSGVWEIQNDDSKPESILYLQGWHAKRSS